MYANHIGALTTFDLLFLVDLPGGNSRQGLLSHPGLLTIE